MQRKCSRLRFAMADQSAQHVTVSKRRKPMPTKEDAEMSFIQVGDHSVKKVGRNTFEGENKKEKIDFVITKTKNVFSVDIFDSTKNDPNDAHLHSFDAVSLHEAVHDAMNWQRKHS